MWRSQSFNFSLSSLAKGDLLGQRWWKWTSSTKKFSGSTNSTAGITNELKEGSGEERERDTGRSEGDIIHSNQSLHWLNPINTSIGKAPLRLQQDLWLRQRAVEGIAQLIHFFRGELRKQVHLGVQGTREDTCLQVADQPLQCLQEAISQHVLGPVGLLLGKVQDDIGELAGSEMSQSWV